jgi:hypothetical protein
MMRISTWKSLSLAVGVTLLAAAIFWVSGDTNLASAFIVCAVLEGGAYAILLAVASVRRKRQATQIVNSD